MSDAWVNKNADPDDPKWIRSRKPPREGWYGVLLKTQLRRRDDDGNIYYVTKYRESVELWDGEKWSDPAGEILAWDRFVLENTCHRPVESDEGAGRWRREKSVKRRSDLLETARILMDESGLKLSELEELTGLDKQTLIRIRKITLAPTMCNVETVIDKLGYEIVVRRKK